MSALAPKTVPAHAPLFLFIRAMVVLFTGFITLLFALVVGGSLIQATNYLKHPQTQGDTQSIIMLFSLVLVGGGLIIVIPCYALVLLRRIFLQKTGVQEVAVPRQVTTADVDVIALLFAGFAAIDLHHFLPRNHSNWVHSSSLIDLFLHRGMVTIIAFFVLKYLSRMILLRVLEIKSP